MCCCPGRKQQPGPAPTAPHRSDRTLCGNSAPFPHHCNSFNIISENPLSDPSHPSGNDLRGCSLPGLIAACWLPPAWRLDSSYSRPSGPGPGGQGGGRASAWGFTLEQGPPGPRALGNAEPLVLSGLRLTPYFLRPSASQR